jgi:Type II CAAX prenyl endopeptidase Rce1-like
MKPPVQNDDPYPSMRGAELPQRVRARKPAGVYTNFSAGVVLIPSKSPLPAIALTGIGYALVHLPDWGITVVSLLAGIFWSSLYYAFRVLSPLALSHAILGSTFYYWIYGEDLFGAWISGPAVLTYPS